MANEYLTQLQGDASQSDNPYLSMLEGEQRARTAALRGTLTQAMGTNPDQFAEQRRVASYLGYPTSAVAALPQLQQQARIQQADDATAGAPVTRTKFTDADFARLAHDDVNNLTTLERVAGGLKGTAKYLFSAPDTPRTLAGDVGAGLFMLSRGAAGLGQAAAEVAAPTLDVFERPDIGNSGRAPVPFLADLPGGNPLRRLAEGFAKMGADAQTQAKELSPDTDSILGGGVSSGVQSLTQNVALLPLALLNPAVGLLTMAASQGGQSFQDAREKGVSLTPALTFAASQAAIEYATEKLPLHKLIGDIKAGTPLFKSLVHNAALEVPGEQVATVLQDLNEWAVLNPDKPFSSYLEERPSAAAQTLIATLIGVGGNVTLGHAMQKAADNAMGVEHTAQQAEAHAQVLQEFVKLAEASKLRERDPGAFAEFAQSLTENDVPNVYVDAKALLAQGDVGQIVQALPSVAAQIQQAAATGGDVVIPTQELLTAGPGQSFMQTLVDHARTAPEAMSAAEAREYMQTKGDQLKADIEQVLGDKQQDQRWADMRDQLRDEFKAQLDGVKRFTSDVNLHYANLLANFYAVTAAKLGVTPQELATKYGLQMRAQGVEGGQQLDQGQALDGVLQAWDAAGIEHAVSESGDRITVSKIVVPESARGQGAGTAAMRQLLEYADRAGKHVVLSPSADFGGDKARLAKFYKGLGFVENKGKNRAFSTSESMYRQAPGKVLHQGAPAKDKGQQAGLSADALRPLSDYESDAQAPTTSDSVGQPGGDFNQEARGSINLPEDLTRSPAIISLFKGADLSTFIHESGHFFLEVQMDLAARIQAQAAEGGALTEGEQAIVNDANTLLAWMGVKGSETTSPLTEWHSLDIEAKRPMHEQFARGFEAYAFEGNAPSVELAGTFAKFRAWLLAVYKELKTLRVELTDDVRGVMDRMLASTQAIQEAEAARRMGPLFKTAEQAGMTLDEFKAYHALATEASQTAIEELQARGLRDMQWLQGAKDRKLKDMQKLHDSLRREVRAEVRAEVMRQPVYRAWQFLTGKPTPVSAEITPELQQYRAALDQWQKDRQLAELEATEAEKAALLSAHPGAKGIERGQLLAKNKRQIGVNVQQALLDWEQENPKPVRPDVAEQEGPDTAAFGKLDLGTLTAMSGKDAADTLKARKMTRQSGIHPDAVAEAVGFESGDQMVKALLDAEAPQSVIEGMTDQRMLERYGDLGTPEGLQRAADRAIHNEVRARFVASEIKALEKGMRVRQDTGVGARGQRVTTDLLAQVARQQAERIIGATRVKNLRPSQYTTAEARAAKAAERAMLAGNTEEALAEKRHQLINLNAAREAVRAHEEVEKIRSYLSRFNDKPKGLDADYYDQIAQLLERFDPSRAVTLKEIGKRKTLAAWVESQREQGLEPDIPADLLDEAYRTSYKDMTVDELRGLRDTVRQIERLGRLKNTLLTAKQLRDFQAVRDHITDSILANANGREADTRTPAAGTFAAWFKKVKDFGAAHIKAATWARVFDGGKDGGPVWEYFIRPANEAADMETRMRGEATEKLAAILEPVLKAGRMDGKGKFFASIGRSMNREQVFAMALNMGNEGNIQRMLDGEGWTINQIQPVLATLSASDWQAVQAVWDHFETYRPLIAAKERRIYGKEPEWVEPMPLLTKTADGQDIQLRGGYYPVKYDPLANNRAEQHADAEDAKRQMQAAYTSATTRRGFTKARAEAVKGRPLLYSLQGVYSGVNDVIHDLAFHEWLIDVNKLLRSDKINDAIRTTYGPEAVRQLKTWIEDTARGEAGLQAELDSALGRLRQGVSVAGLGFNVMSAIMQPLGLTQSIVRVGGKWVGRGLAQYAGAPATKTREVNAKSDFMAGRARTRFRELNELRNQVEGQSGTREFVGRYGYFLMMRMQQAVDVPTWLGAYEKAMADGQGEDRAIALADQAVIDAQGGGQTKDLSAIERGGPAQKLFTVFYSFMNTALNIGVAQTMTEKSRAKLAADYLLLFTVPAVLGAVLKDALTPGDSGDWDSWEAALKKLLGEQISYLFGLLVVAREFGEAAKSAMGLVEHSRDYSGPAGVRMIADTYGLAKQVSQGELDDAFRKQAVNVLGDLLGLPSAQINRTVTGAEALADGDTQNPAALLFGYQKP